MLPRFSAVADVFDKHFSDHFNKSLDEKLGPFLRDIPGQRQFEGAGWRLTTPDRDSRKLFETFETGIKIKLDEVPRITVDELHQRVEEAANEIFRKKWEEWRDRESDRVLD